MFIDADKQNYIHYYELGLKLLRSGGMMMIDNVLWSGRVADATNIDPDTVAIRKLNNIILNDTRVEIALLPISDGLFILRKK